MKAVAVVPGLGLLASYEARWLRRDLVAGLVLTALLVPQGMAYAELAGLPPITGLYTSILCLLGYALFGPSRILVLGPDSSLGPMIAATVLPLVAADGDPARAVALGSALALMTGGIALVAGIGRLGFVADLISKPTMIGYMNGLAVTILVGQLPKLCGFSVDAEGFLGEVAGFVQGIGAGETVPAAVAVGLGGVILILALQRFVPKVPAVLVVVVLSIGAAGFLGLEQHGLSVVGPLPQGFPPLTFPRIALSDIPVLLAGALAIAVVSLADTISTVHRVRGTQRADRRRQPGDDRRRGRQLRGRVVPGVPGQHERFPHGGGRAGRGEDAGHRPGGRGRDHVDPAAGPGLLRNLPQPTLAAVVIAASLSLADVKATARLYRLRRTEFLLSMAAFFGVVLLGVLPGIALAVALSIGNVFRRAWWPYQAILGRAPGVPGYHDVRSYPMAQRLAGCAIFRFDAPVFFANARTFREQIRALADAEPRPRWIVVAAEPITDVDITAADMLLDLDLALNADGVNLVFAEMKDPVRRKIDRYELTSTIEPSHFFPTLEAAIAAFQRETGAQWGPATAQEAP